MDNFFKKYWFYLILPAFVLAFVIIESKNQKFFTNDLKVYYGAIENFSNDKTPYGQYYELKSGYFKYPPPSLLFFYPMSFFDFGTVKFIHVIINLLSLIAIFYILNYFEFNLYDKKIKEKSSTRNNNLINLIVFLSVAVHLTRELHMGNINVLLITLLLYAVYLSLYKPILFPLFISILIFVKPITVIVIVPLLFDDFKSIVKIGLISLGFIVLQVLYTGIDFNYELWMQWFNELKNHGNHVHSTNTIQYILEWYLGVKINLIVLLFIFLVTQIVIGILLKKMIKKDKIELWMLLNMAMIPSFFVTDEQHFILALPIVFILINNYPNYLSGLFKTLTVVFVLIYSINSNDLLGKPLKIKYEDFAALGISNIAIVVLCLALCVNGYKTKNIVGSI